MNTSAVSPFTLTKEQYQELYQDVMTFSHIGGVVNDEEGIWKMCHEEFVNELLPAIEAEDRIQVIDGCGDSFVVFTQLHHHFMSKPSWEQPRPSCGPITAYNYQIDNTTIEIAIKTKYERLVPFIMDYIVGYGEYLAQDFNFDLYKAIKEVNRSNMTKFPTLQQLFQRYDPFCIKYGQRQLWEVAAKDCEELSKGKYKNVVAIEVFNGLEYVAAFRENFGKGKIVKHLAFYEEPDFTHCLLETSMTTIYLKEDVKIEIDGYNHTLMKFIPGGKETKIGGKDVITKDRWETLGYYPNIEQAVRALATRFQDYGDLQGLEAYTRWLKVN